MNVDFPSYPILRKKRILVVSEYPSYDAITSDNLANPLFGPTWEVLNRVFFYLKISPNDFSYSPIIRCWRNPSHIVSQKDYDTCRDYIGQFATLTEAPAIITLGSMATKYSLEDKVCFKDGKYLGNDYLRKSWKTTPHKTIYGLPGIPTEHPASIRLVRCNSQINFRAMCVDFIRAIEFAGRTSDSYSKIAAGLDRSEYITDYNLLQRTLKEATNG